MKSVSLSEIYRVIAGHSNYHGDSILAAFTCIAEGKEVSPIKPIETVEPVRGEWAHIGGDEWCCSNCGHVISTEGSWEKPEKKFCEECGCDMRTSAK